MQTDKRTDKQKDQKIKITSVDTKHKYLEKNTSYVTLVNENLIGGNINVNKTTTEIDFLEENLVSKINKAVNTTKAEDDESQPAIILGGSGPSPTPNLDDPTQQTQFKSQADGQPLNGNSSLDNTVNMTQTGSYVNLENKNIQKSEVVFYGEDTAIDQTIWLDKFFRLVFMIGFGFIAWCSLIVIFAASTLNFILTVAVNKPNSLLTKLCVSLAVYLSDIVHYLSFATNTLPFPLGKDMPSSKE